MRQMLAFVAVYKFQHMSAAADELSLTQPAVTVLIKELEQKLGVKLFDRATRQLKPTEAAEKVMPYILRSLSELDDLNQMMHEYKELKDGYFTLAITPNSAQSILSDLLSGFTAQYPKIKVNLLECEPLDLLPSLFKEKADICLGSMQAQLPFIDQHIIMQDQIVAIHHPNYVLKHTIETWHDIKKQRLILTKHGYGIRQQIEQHLFSIDPEKTLDVGYEVSLISTVVSLVKSQLGVGLVPYSSIQHIQDRLCVYMLNEPVLTREMSLFHLKEKSLNPSAQAFLNHCLAQSHRVNLD